MGVRVCLLMCVCVLYVCGGGCDCEGAGRSYLMSAY